MKVLDNVAERRSHVGRLARKESDKAKGSRTGVLAEQQAEVVTAGSLDAGVQHAPPCPVRDGVIGVVENAEIEAGPGKDLLGLHIEFPQQIWNATEGRDPHLPMSH